MSKKSSFRRGKRFGAFNGKQVAEILELRAALVEGEQSGESTPFDFDEFIAGKRVQKTG